MTADLGDRRAAEPDPVEDSGWWDRHGWELPVPSPLTRAERPAHDSADDDRADDDRADDDRADESADDGGAVWFGWSALLVCVAVAGSLVTLPVLGFAGGLGRVLAPTLWALLGTGVGVSLSAREPAWDLDRRRVEPLAAWLLAYTVAAVVGMRFFEDVAAWWVPATVLTALAPVVTARVRRRER